MHCDKDKQMEKVVAGREVSAKRHIESASGTGKRLDIATSAGVIAGQIVQ